MLPLVAACNAIRFWFGSTNNRGLKLECEGNASNFVGLASNIRRREEEAYDKSITLSNMLAEVEKNTIEDERFCPTENHTAPETCKAHDSPFTRHLWYEPSV